MEYLNHQEPREIVLTYRQEPEEVVLHSRQPLPQRMLTAQESARPDANAAPQRKKRRRRRALLGISLLLLLISAGVGIGFALHVWREEAEPADDDRRPAIIPPYYEGNWEEEPEEEETTIDTYRPYGVSTPQLELEAAPEGTLVLSPGAVYDAISPSTVTIIAASRDSYRVGTGIIFSGDGYILTNHHIIAGCEECEVWVTDQHGVDATYPALLVGGDAGQDLAVLKVDAENLPAARFGVSDELKVGDTVYAIGNPLGLELRGTFTDGIVSAINRDVEMDGVIMTLIQTNAALNNGNSGGPLVNRFGQVVGINTIKMMSDYDTIEGLGFAIPTSLAVRWVNDIIETGEIPPQPVLGVSLNRIPETLPDGTVGLRVEELTPGLGADRAGIQLGDYVVAFAGEPVSSTEEVLRLRRQFYVGDMVEIRIFRDGEYLDLTMEMLAE